MNAFKLFRNPEKSIPWLFALLTMLAYGLAVFQTGFYWDDWPFAWTAQFMGPASFLRSFLRVRPFLGPIFWLTTTLLPTTPLAWQFFALLMRFALTLAAWWTFHNLWPQRPWQTLLAALAFLVYPGYSQHWVALTHINQELIPFLFYLLSFGMTGLAIRSVTGSRRRTILALLLLTLGVFPTEYFLSLEPLRFLFILVTLEAPAGRPFVRFWQAIRAWLPYLVIWAADIAWLDFYYHSGIYANYNVVIWQIAPTLSGILLNLLSTLGEALLKAGLLAWFQLPILAAQAPGAPSTWLALGVSVITLGILWMFFTRLKKTTPFSNSTPGSGIQAWAWNTILIGIAGILLGRIPSWAAGLPLTLGSSFDRFTVSMLPGASLLAAGLLSLLLQKRQYWISAAAVLIALGAGQQAYTASIFRRDWARQLDLYWQLAWRIPALQPNSVLMTDEVEMDYETDYSLTAPLNWIYAPQLQPTRLPYLLVGVGERPGKFPSLEPGQDFQFAYRPIRFYGNTSQMVGFVAAPNACLHILDPLYDKHTNLARQSPFYPQIVQLSNPDLILTDAPVPTLPAAIFGPEPPHSWCYYYTRAEFFRQRGDWATVARLGQEAEQLGYRARVPAEWLPFIEAYAITGQPEKAESLSLQTISDSTQRKGLCALWSRVQQKQPIRDGLLNELGCQ